MTDPTLRVLSWNCGERPDAWSQVAAQQPDVALLQRVPPGEGEPLQVLSPEEPGGTVVAVADGVKAEPVPLVPLADARPGALGISRAGSLAVAVVHLPEEPPVHVVSVYASWEDSFDGSWGYPDAAAHRVVSDLAALVGPGTDHRLVVAGDWNVTRGWDDEQTAWAMRYNTVFARLEAMGLRVVGPCGDRGQAVATYREADGSQPRQLDHVVVSESLADRVRTGVLHDGWTSDHCMVTVDLLRAPA